MYQFPQIVRVRVAAGAGSVTVRVSRDIGDDSVFRDGTENMIGQNDGIESSDRAMNSHFSEQ
jgi:hypothetical protein